jgi:F420-non-reducing hydrogenase iron-sulfur subunit
VESTKKLLDEIGLGGERLEMVNMSSAEGQKFADAASEMTERCRRLGPNPVKKGSGGSS